MFRQYRKIENGEQFVIGADTSAGGGDKCTVQFLSKNKLDVPLVYQSNEMATVMTNEIFPVLEKIYDITGQRSLIAYERNNGGLFEMERLASLNRQNKFEVFKMPQYGKVDNQDPVKVGWDTNSATRPKMISELKTAIDKRLVALYDRATIEELYSFIIVPSSSSWKAQAERGAHDDLVFALAIAWQLHLIQGLVPTTQGAGPFAQFKDKAQWKRPTDPTINI